MSDQDDSQRNVVKYCETCRGVASRLHGLAELRGDCKCGLIAPDNAGETPLTVPPLPLAMKNSSIMDMEASLTQSVGKSGTTMNLILGHSREASDNHGCMHVNTLPLRKHSSTRTPGW